jgi:hypothetical protein
MKTTDVLNEEIDKVLKHNREHLSPNSVTTYRNAIKKVYNLVPSFPKGLDTKLNLLSTHPKEVDEAIAHIPSHIRKTFYSALIVYTQGNDAKVSAHYLLMMKSDIAEYNKEQGKNEKSEAQDKNWMPWMEVLETVNKLKKKITPLWKDNSVSKEDLMLLFSYALISCYTLVPPRRALDYINLKFRDDDGVNNFYNSKKSTLTFRIYKTAKIYGDVVEKVPTALKIVLNKWLSFKSSLKGTFIKMAESDYVFPSLSGKPMTNNEIVKILNGIFKKKISVSMLRHIYITDTLQPKIKELKEIAGDMGHSSSQQALYIKNDKV